MEQAIKKFPSLEDKKLFSWDKLLSEDQQFSDAEYPKVSVIIPTVNSAQLITMTLERVLMQDYPNLEVIIIDSSTDRTLENVKHFQSNKVRIYSVSESTRFEMINRGLLQATGDYINILFPGDYYIHKGTIKYMMGLALKDGEPDVTYCATLIRDGWRDPKVLFRPFSRELLTNGQQPTSLQACWVRLDALRKLGKFSPELRWRGGFELMCRLKLEEEIRIISTNRVLIDYDLRSVTRRMILAHFWETFRTVYRYFGFKAVTKWLWKQDDSRRYMSLWQRSIKIAFSGSKGSKR